MIYKQPSIYKLGGGGNSEIVDGGNKTESDIIGGKLSIESANSFTRLVLTSISNLEVIANSGIPNFTLYIDNTSNLNFVTISVKTSDSSETLYYSFSGGNVVGNSEKFILTALGNTFAISKLV